jgi:uncharacterized membrane protein YeiB
VLEQRHDAATRERFGATEVSARSLAPDLARGAMLLLIALGNAHLFLYQHRPVGLHAYPVPESTAERLAVLIPITFFDGRELPLFAFLFGYGAVQLSRRHTREGADQHTVRSLIRWRGWCMILIGFLHAVLLFGGDIIGAYGLVAVALAGVLVRTSDRKLLIAAGLGMVPIGAVAAWSYASRPHGQEYYLPTLQSLAATGWLRGVGGRLSDWLTFGIPTALFLAAPPVLLGAWAARRRILDEPERHRRLLLRVTVIGLGLGYLGGLPLAVQAASLSLNWSPSTSMDLAGVAHTVTGYAGAIGYAALAGLLAIRFRDRPGRVVTALAACGQRSMTCYILQSLVFVGVLASYGGGLGNRLGLVSTAVLAIATWALSVVVAEAMSRRGYRGPAEVLLRRLTYRRFRTPNLS